MKRALAVEVNQPKRSFRGQIEGTQGIPLEEPEYNRQKACPEYCHQSHQRLDKLSRYL